MFKKKRGIKIPYNKQGLIYFTCMNIRSQPAETQEKIKRLCREVAGDYYDALFAMLTDDTKNVNAVSMKYYISESQLYLYRKKFYEAWENRDNRQANVL